MKVYVNNDYEVYTEETIDEEIANRLERWDYQGLYEYIDEPLPCDRCPFAK